MPRIQERKRIKEKREYSEFLIQLPKFVVDKMALKKGDILDFNGEYGDEIRFKIRRA